MAPIAQAETAGGLAFEVPIKSQEGAEMMTPARARLESYSKSGGDLPSLLRASARRPPSGPRGPAGPDATKSPAGAEGAGAAERARAWNEKAQAVAARVHGEREAHTDALQRSLEQGLEKAAQKRDASLADKTSKATKYCQEVQAKVGHCRGEREAQAGALQRNLEQELQKAAQKHGALLSDRSSKAGQHYKEVQAKVCNARQHQEDASVEQQSHLSGKMLQKKALQIARALQRSARAAQHNRKVAETLRRHQQSARRSREELRAELQAAERAGAAIAVAAAEERAAAARRHNEEVVRRVGEHREAARRQAEELKEELWDKMQQGGVAGKAAVPEAAEVVEAAGVVEVAKAGCISETWLKRLASVLPCATQ